MKKLLLGTGAALTAALSATLSALPSEARPLTAQSGYRVAQFSEPVLTPTLPSINPKKSPKYVGYVTDYDGSSMVVRLTDGTIKQFLLPENVGGDSLNVATGDLVALNADRSDRITAFDAAIPGEVTYGSVSRGENGLEVATEAGATVPISEAIANQLMLAPGDEVKVTTIQNIAGLTSVCKVKRAAVEPPVPAPPVFQPAPPPVIPPAPEIRGLW
ncbi:hypothetical protein [Lyngbya confervoides]|uniref:Uncharacterized protein n=1 Tax=Lyngbya confervoides BDU141951 TaxID=1574623 RepID=A0ABD4T8M5_9CYAN|nr:hypothetical protein [Lyngbya confervoides]MCM1984665.1 hypothetical protein [Lyngbya confervoides BDU141951]